MDIFSKSHESVTGFRELFFVARDLSRSDTKNIHDKIIVLIVTGLEKVNTKVLFTPSRNTRTSSHPRKLLGRFSLHSRRILDTVVSEPGSGLPWYRRVVFVDDQVNYIYTSDTQRAQPGPVWMAQKEGPEFWDEMTWWAQRYQKWYNASLNTLSQLYNQSKGFHIIQTMFGCDLREDGIIQGFYQDSYDGRDFLTFDKETMTWVAADIGAQITKRRWHAEVDDNQGWTHFLEETCISWLRSALEFGKETLQRKVSDRSSHDGLTTLSCKVSGFYPQDITVTWLRNGENRQQETYSEGILPSGDGTYQTWVTMEIDPTIRAHYSCWVEHESLLEPLSVSWGKEFVCLSIFLVGEGESIKLKP
uniref:Ig-like domain-containing protein n=1 Tax=Gopherus evgoodei TaxID=1825980 RepID=A0A8C4YLP1_9SAUR